MKAVKFSTREIVLVSIVATLILLWTSVPNLAGYRSQTEEFAYRGAFFDPSDYSAHIAMIRAGMQGEWSYSLRFTTEQFPTAYVRLFYILTGEVNRILNLKPEAIFEISRWAFGYAALFTLFGLIKRLYDRPLWQWTAFFLITLGSGLGLLALIQSGSANSTDFWLIDAYIWFSLALFPHFAFTLTLMCLSLLTFFDFLQTGGWLRVIVIILSAFLVQMAYPTAFILADITFGAAALIQWIVQKRIDRKQFAALSIIAIAQVPLFAYNFVLLTHDPLWSQYTIQHATPSPPFNDYLWGFGLFWPLAILGVAQSIRTKNSFLMSMLAWLILAFALAYSPLVTQRRFLLGVTIPFGLLSTSGLIMTLEWAAQKINWLTRRFNQAALAIIIVCIISSTGFFQITAASFYLSTRPEALFYPRALDGAFEWLARHSNSNDFILSADTTGLLIAQKTGRRVFLGHLMETLNYNQKVAQVKDYYQGSLPVNWIEQFPIRWVFYGPYEKKDTPGFQAYPNLELVYQNKGVQIFKVR